MKNSAPSPAVARAVGFLRKSLAKGPRERRELFTTGRASGYSRPALIRAKKAAGILHTPQGAGPSKWSLPTDSTDSIRAVAHWYTPANLMTAVHDVLGPCALDPCSPPQPVHVQAVRWFSKEHDGLQQPWDVGDGWLWCNPPWGQGRGKPEIPAWVDKLLSESVPRWLVLVPDRQSKACDRLGATGATRILLDARALRFGGAEHPVPYNTILFVHGFDPATVEEVRLAIVDNGIKAQRLVG